jgi:hypothetical protein
VIDLGVAPILALLVGIFHGGLFVLWRGTGSGRTAVTFLAAVLGAWAGDAFGALIGLDLLQVGDFRLVAASLGAWIGIGLVAVIAILGPETRPSVGRFRRL